jgi:mRNA interferase RelE/StbE
MASYRINLKRSVEKDLRRLPGAQLPRVLSAIDQLSSDPHPRGATKLSGAETLYRVRVGDYRLIYEVDTETREVTIHYLRHRREAYRGL